MKKILVVLITILTMASLFASQDVTVRLGGAYGLSVGKTARDAITTDLDRADYNISGLGFDAGVEFNLGSNLILYTDFSMTFPSKITLKDPYTRESLKENYEANKSYWEEGGSHEPYEQPFLAKDGGSFLSTIDLHLGLTKCVFSNNNMALYLGAGFGMYRTKFGFRMTMLKEGDSEGEYDTSIYYYDSFKIVATISADVYARFAYNFSDRFSLSIIAMPALSFFNVTRDHSTDIGNTGPFPIEGKYYFNPDSYPDPDKKITGINPHSENSGFALGFNLGVKLGATYSF
ncbi:MAG: hypothetical protein ACSW74_01570 [Spirochaetales bacterium]